MKRFRRWLVGAILGLLLVLLAAWLFTDPILRQWIERSVRRQAGLEMAIGNLHFGWASARLRLEDLQLKNPPEFGGGFLLRVPTVAVHFGWASMRLRLENLQLQNPPEFGGGLLLHMPAAAVDLDVGDLRHGRLHFRDLRLHVAELNLVRNREGQLNLRLPVKPPPGTNTPARSDPPPVRPKPAEEYQFGGIDRLELTLGRLTYTNQLHPVNNSELDFGDYQEVITNLQTSEDAKIKLQALLLRVAMLDYVVDPAKSRSRLWDMLFRTVDGL